MALTPSQVEAFTELHEDLASFNDRLEVVSLHPSAGILVEGRERWVTFTIARSVWSDWGEERPDRYTLFGFEARGTEPVDPLGYPPSEQAIGALAANLCEAANRAIFSNVDFWDVLSELSPDLAEARFNPVIAELAETAYLRLLVAQRFAAAEILIRGYADAAGGDWSEPLGDRPVRVEVLPLRDQGASDAVFRAEPVETEIGRDTSAGRVFGNNDLPNLRADTIARLIDRMTDRCRDGGAGVAGVGVLQGYVVPRRAGAYRRTVGYLQVPIP